MMNFGTGGEERQMSSVLDLKASKFHRLIVFSERAAGKKLPNWANKKMSGGYNGLCQKSVFKAKNSSGK